MHDPPDHGDDEQVQGRADADRRRVDLAVPPDVQDPRHAGDEPRQRER